MPRPIKPRVNHDHFGFYEVGPNKTYSKLEAIELSSKLGIDVSWNYNKDVFEKFDWTVEPPGTLDFWYGERARQLREAYDYIVIFYSGGPDSWNMLKAFVDNNIYVDEIAHYVLENGTSLRSDSLQNEEIYKTSYPTAKQIIENNPTYKTTKQRVIDGGKNVIQRVPRLNKYDYWYEQSNYFFGPWANSLGEFRDLEPDYKDLIDKKKTVCFIWGYDKPTMKITSRIDGGNNFAIEFSENGLSNFVKPKYQQEKVNWMYDEAFYWTPDMPEIPCKQGHIIKRFLENVNDSMVDGFFLKYYNPNENETITYKVRITKNNKTYELSHHGAHRLIYDGWNVNTIVCPKSPSPTLSAKDEWWFRSNVSESKWYLKGIYHLRDHIKKIHPTWWHEAKHDPKKELYRGWIKLCKVSYSLN